MILDLEPLNPTYLTIARPSRGSAQWLRVASMSPSGERVGRCLLLQGRSEFIEKYTEVIGELLGRGLEVWTMDWRGQGRSSRLLPDRFKGHIDDYSTHIKDLRALEAHLPPLPDHLPTVMLAHSMGGHIALRYLSAYSDGVDGLVTTAPMIDVYASPALYALSRRVAATMCAAGQGHRWLNGARTLAEELAAKFEDNALTRDRRRFNQIHDTIAVDGEVAIGGFTAGWLDATMRSIRLLYQPHYIAQITIPVCIVCALDDVRVSVAAQRDVARWLPDGELVELPGALHEVLFEEDLHRERFWEAFDRFLARLRQR